MTSTGSDTLHGAIAEEPSTPSAVGHLEAAAISAKVRVTMQLSPATAAAATIASPDEKSRVADLLAVTEKLIKSVANRDLATFELACFAWMVEFVC